MSTQPSIPPYGGSANVLVGTFASSISRDPVRVCSYLTINSIVAAIETARWLLMLNRARNPAPLGVRRVLTPLAI